MQNLADVADSLRQLRKDLGLSQKELAEAAALSRVTVNRMEMASQGDMSVLNLLKLAGALGYELTLTQQGHQRTIDDILREQKNSGSYVSYADIKNRLNNLNNRKREP